VTSYFKIVPGIVPGSTVPVVIMRGQERLTIKVHYIVVPANADALRREYYARCMTQGQSSVAHAIKRGDYQTAFTENVKIARCAARIRNASAFNSAVVAFAKIVPKLRPSPAIPSEAERHNERAVSILKAAGNDGDIDKASYEFGEAVVEAPWVPDLYLNLALSYDKAGYPEWAIQYLRGYLLLNPTARDAEQIKQKIAELEVLAEERKPWLPFTGTAPISDGASQVVSLRGRKLVLRVVHEAGQNQTPSVGDDIFLSATIDGNRFEGKAFVHPNAPSAEPFSRRDPEGWIRCFGSDVMALDAKGEIQPGGAQFRVTVKEPGYNAQSCVIVRHDWALEAIENARVSQ
jgi:tetratricopeptide (TPR) repeat protein